MNTLGLAHLRAGQLDEAARCFHQALPSHPILNWLGLALVDHARGQTEDARQWLGKAIEAMEQRPDLCEEDHLQGQLLRREVEQLLRKSEEEKHGTERKEEASGAEPKPTDTKAATSEPSAAEPKSIEKPKSPLTADPASAGA